MPRVQYVGRPSLHFYGKYLSEIARNLKNRAIGRVVIKETEASKYEEPCFFILERIVPLFSDESSIRCRAWGRRYFRGHDFGTGILPGTHEPDWRLASSEEANNLLSLVSRNELKAHRVPVRCVAPMPPLLTLHLLQNKRLPETAVTAAKRSLPEMGEQFCADAHGYLLLTKLEDDPTLLEVPVEPTEEEQCRIHPPYPIASAGGLVAKKTLDRDSYFIRRSDTPGLYWRVITTKVKDTDSTEASK